MQSIVHGEAHDFEDWPALIARLISMLPDLEPELEAEENELC